MPITSKLVARSTFFILILASLPLQAAPPATKVPTSVQNRLALAEASLKALRGMPNTRLCRTTDERNTCEAVIAQAEDTLAKVLAAQGELFQWYLAVCVDEQRARNCSQHRQSAQAVDQLIKAAVAELTSARQEFQTAFENFDQKANQLYNVLSTVLKGQKEMTSAISRSTL